MFSKRHRKYPPHFNKPFWKGLVTSFFCRKRSSGSVSKKQIRKANLKAARNTKCLFTKKNGGDYHRHRILTFP